MPILYNPYKKKGVFMIPAGGLGPSVSADFSYSKSSYHQDEANPTPTITGTPGGAFICTSGAVFVDTGSTSSSTGQIDLDASTIDTHLISYTVDGVTATANVGITASPFLANTYSMEFDGVDDYIDVGSTIDLGLNSTVSMWLNLDSGYNGILLGEDGYSFDYLLYPYYTGFAVRIASTAFNYPDVPTYLTAGSWHHLVVVRSGDSIEVFVDGVSRGTNTGFGTATNTKFDTIAAKPNGTLPLEGKIDELAAWNTALSSDAVTEIYNATANNTGKALDLSTDYNNYTSSSNLQYWNRLGD